jgi:hypothetical protein
VDDRIRALASGLASSDDDDAYANLVSATGSPDVTLEVIPTIRRHSTGASPRARDLRTDRSTARVGEVLAGELDLLRDPTR